MIPSRHDHSAHMRWSAAAAECTVCGALWVIQGDRWVCVIPGREVR